MARPKKEPPTNNHRLNRPEANPNTKPNKPKKKHRLFIWLIILIILGVGGYGILKFNKNYDIADSPSSIIAINRESKNSKKFVMEYYWQPHCKDCTKVNKAGIEKSIQKAALKNRVVKINTNQFKKNGNRNHTDTASQWFAANYVTQTPTLIIKYHGKPVYLYSGTNIKIFNKLLAGKDPQTNKPLPHKVPTHEVYLNDFDNSKQNFVSVDPIE